MSDDDVFSDDEDLDIILRQAPVAIRSSEGYEEVPTPKNIPVQSHHFTDYAALSTYIYPTNYELRDYQYNIVARAFYDNLLVALPTGLGKTFIASTVMLNFHRWFPQSKIIFMAPTKPLVAQQIRACCGIAGISSSKAAILLDKTKKNREAIWDEKHIFFTTPQVVENDLTAGLVSPKDVVLLVIDEAHRAKGNYAYNNVCQYLRRFNPLFRVLALTATPASDVEGVQEIINNLQISKIEVRTENSIDIVKYMKRKRVDRISVGLSVEISECVALLSEAIAPILQMCNERKIYEITDPAKINAFQAMEASQKIVKNPSIPEGLKWLNFFLLQLLGVVGQALRRLNIYGIRSFYHYFEEKHREFTTKYKNKKSTNHTAATFYMHANVTRVLQKAREWMEDPSFLGHPKLDVVMSELSRFYGESTGDSKVIIFTEFRESALDIVKAIENSGDENLKPHIFIGQAKEREKFDETKFLQKGKKKNKKAKEKEKEKSTPDGSRTSSEDAQLKGMNQKMQKQLIKDFKGDKYNILVATSIGEEGLDIGEVDLIICFDSTSSPIKNIQRMGRTGRKRDGRVILLFASNEETKFDKAMGGYEYIQKHIMSGRLIELCESNRIISPEYKPVVDKRFIEIPEENLELKTEADDDEILRIAQSYMNGDGRKRKKKKFHMPDGVETGFRSVTLMVRRRGDEVSLAEKRQRDLLDDLAGSDKELSQRVEEVKRGTPNTSMEGGSVENSISLDSDEEPSRKQPKVAYKTQRPITSHFEYAPKVEVGVRRPMRTLGPRRPTIMDQLKKQKRKTEEHISEILDKIGDEEGKSAVQGTEAEVTNLHEEVQHDVNNANHQDDFLNSPEHTNTYTEKHQENVPLHFDNPQGPPRQENVSSPDLTSDDFDDGLDDVLCRVLNERTSSNLLNNSNPQSPEAKIVQMPLFPASPVFVAPDDGTLTEGQRFELFASYYTHIRPSENLGYCDPHFYGPVSHGQIAHSKTTEGILRSLHPNT